MSGNGEQRMLRLPAKKLRKALLRSSIAMVILFIPGIQLFSAAVAFPLFMLADIATNSDFMAYTFAYFFPKNLATTAIFAVYYFAVYYVLELPGNIKNILPLGPRIVRCISWLRTIK
jgi:uncharacterized protein involved in cysteine biosynthesis